jgi:hypothetical protein
MKVIKKLFSGKKKTFFICYFLLFGLTVIWAYADPLFSRPDEIPDIFRAESIVRGQLLGPPAPQASLYNSEVIVTVPATLKKVANLELYYYYCYYNPYKTGPYNNCPARFSNEGGTFYATTNEGRYSPTYFYLTGLPTLISPTSGGIIATRVISDLLDSFFLALAITLALYRKSPVALLGVTVAITPTVLFYNGSLNPNGFENSTFIAAWAAIASLSTIDYSQVVNKAEIRFAIFTLGLSLTTGVTARASSPAWTIFLIVIWVFLARKKIAILFKEYKSMTFWTISFSISFLLSVIYILWAKAYIIMRPAFGPSNSRLAVINDIVIKPLGQALKSIIAEFAVYPADVWLPVVYYFLWISGLVVGLIVVMKKVDNFKRLALLILVFSPIIIPSALEFVQPSNLMWFPWLGRYEMPGTLGLAVVVGYELSAIYAKDLTLRILKVGIQDFIKVVSFIYLLVLLFIQLLSIWWDLRHYEVGQGPAINVWFYRSVLNFPAPLEIFSVLLLISVALYFLKYGFKLKTFKKSPLKDTFKGVSKSPLVKVN